jgi:hypothetical protein
MQHSKQVAACWRTDNREQVAHVGNHNRSQCDHNDVEESGNALVVYSTSPTITIEKANVAYWQNSHSLLLSATAWHYLSLIGRLSMCNPGGVCI